MEWQGVITGEADRPLATLASVSAKLTALFPGLSFEWSSTGADQLAALEARGVELPDRVRRVVAAEPSSFCGSIEVGPVSVSFNLGTGDLVTCVWAGVGGEREPVEGALVVGHRRTDEERGCPNRPDGSATEDSGKRMGYPAIRTSFWSRTRSRASARFG
jgi:hypothetical protein